MVDKIFFAVTDRAGKKRCAAHRDADVTLDETLAEKKKKRGTRQEARHQDAQDSGRPTGRTKRTKVLSRTNQRLCLEAGPEISWEPQTGIEPERPVRPSPARDPTIEEVSFKVRLGWSG